MSAKLTVIIPCKNERLNIRACIESTRGIADEILVADSGSTDETREIAAEYDCRIVEREYVNSGNFKNWAIPQARQEWVLIIDADERVTPELAAEISGLLAAGPPLDGYWIYRDNFFLGHRIRYSGWGTDRVLRLFRRDLGQYQGESDHAEVAVSSGRVGRLANRLTHYTYRSYEQMLPKFHRYAGQQADTWHLQGRKASWFQMLSRGPLRFLQTYLLRGGFLDGLPGLQICCLTAYASFLKQAKLWELEHAKPPTEVAVRRRAA